MLKATIFKYAENKLVRTMELGGEPWFVLWDVCEVLSLSTPAKVAERLDMDEVSQAHITDSMGRPRGPHFESGSTETGHATQG